MAIDSRRFFFLIPIFDVKCRLFSAALDYKKKRSCACFSKNNAVGNPLALPACHEQCRSRWKKSNFPVLPSTLCRDLVYSIARLDFNPTIACYRIYWVGSVYDDSEEVVRYINCLASQIQNCGPCTRDIWNRWNKYNFFQILILS